MTVFGHDDTGRGGRVEGPMEERVFSQIGILLSETKLLLSNLLCQFNKIRVRDLFTDNL